MASSTARAALPMSAADPARVSRRTALMGRAARSCNRPPSASRRHLEDPLRAAVVEAQVEALLAVGPRDDVSRDELIKRAGYRHFDLRAVLGPECPPYRVRLERRLAHGARGRCLDGLLHRSTQRALRTGRHGNIRDSIGGVVE